LVTCVVFRSGAVSVECSKFASLFPNVSAAFLPPLHEILRLFPSRTFVGTFFYAVCVNVCGVAGFRRFFKSRNFVVLLWNHRPRSLLLTFSSPIVCAIAWKLPRGHVLKGADASATVWCSSPSQRLHVVCVCMSDSSHLVPSSIARLLCHSARTLVIATCGLSGWKRMRWNSMFLC